MPERKSLRTGLRTGFYRRLWNSSKQSPCTLDGVVKCAADTAPNGPLSNPSGLSRAQQLVVFNTLKLPVLPYLYQNHGGFGVDRALPLFGGSNWWSAFLLRIKLQQYLERRTGTWREQIEELGKGDHYALCLKTRARLGRKTVVDTRVEAQSISNIHRALRVGETNGDDVQNNDISQLEGISARADVTHKMRGHKLSFSAATQDHYQSQGRLLCIPHMLSAEFSTDEDRKALHYKIGVHEVKGDVTCDPGPSSDGEPSLKGVYLQGGLGIDGEFTLWSRSRKKRSRALEEETDVELSESDLMDLGGGTESSGEEAITEGVWDEDIGLEGYSDDSEKVAENKGGPGFASAAASAGFLRGGESRVGEAESSEAKKDGRNSNSVLSILRRQVVSVKEVSQELLRMTNKVQTGLLVSALQKDNGKGRRGRGYSARMFLPTPHLKVGGLAGVTGSIRMPNRASEMSHQPPADPSTSSQPGPSLRRLSARRSAQRDTPVKAFIGASVSAQVGQMKRPILDFSAVLAQLELNMPVPSGTGRFRSSRLQGARSWQNLTAQASKLPFVPILNLSLAQQAIGPIRLKADYRFSLDSRGGALGGTGTGPWSVLRDHVQNLRPSLTDVQYGLDFSIPGTHGAVRLNSWYVPARKEGMIEIRMF